MKKGFTLAELLAVVVILSLLTLLSINVISSIVESGKEDIKNAQKKLVLNAAKLWGTDYADLLPSSTGCKYILVSDLSLSGYIKGDISDLDYNSKIVVHANVTSRGKLNYTYEFEDGETPSECLLTYFLEPGFYSKDEKYTWDELINMERIEVEDGAIIGSYLYNDTSFQLVVPEGITRIEDNVFGYNYYFNGLVLPKSLTYLGTQDSIYLESLYIPENVTYVGSIYHLKSVSVDPNNTVYDSRNNCNAVIETETNTLVIGSGSTVIPNGVEAIADYVFQDVPIKSLVIPDSVTTIGYGALSYNRDLENIVLGKGITEIGDSMFTSNWKLKSVTIPDSVTSIGDHAFQYSGLTSITIPDSVTSIGDYAFWQNSIKSIYIGSGLESFDSSSFEYNPIETIVVSPNNQYYDSRNGCNAIIYTDSDDLIIGSKNTVIPDGIISIGSSAFENLGITSITIPDSVIFIGSRAFEGNKLTSINIPSGITTIGFYTFYDNELTSVSIPETISYISDSAFAKNNISSVSIGSKVTSISDGAFRDNPITSITVNPNNKKYDSRNNCNAIIEKATNKIIQGSLSTAIPNTVTVIGRRAFSGINIPTLTIPSSVTTIEEYAFEDSGLTNIVIPDTVTTIGQYAFGSTYSLTSVTLPSALTTISTGMFSGSKFTSITIPDSVTTIGNSAFWYCNLTSITIPDSVTTIEKNAFRGNKLKSVYIGSGVIRIESGAFSSNSSLSSATFAVPTGWKYSNNNNGINNLNNTSTAASLLRNLSSTIVRE